MPHEWREVARFGAFWRVFWGVRQRATPHGRRCRAVTGMQHFATKCNACGSPEAFGFPTIVDVAAT